MSKQRIEINNLQDLHKNLDYLPTVAIKDINKRMSDWTNSGGSLEDYYIKQQYKYAENIANAVKDKQGGYNNE